LSYYTTGWHWLPQEMSGRESLPLSLPTPLYSRPVLQSFMLLACTTFLPLCGVSLAVIHSIE